MKASELRKKIVSQNVRSSGLSSATPDESTVSGRSMISGPGEATFHIYFPLKFTSIPLFTYGFEVKRGEAVVDGYKPTSSAYVSQWDMQPVTGPSGSLLTAHYFGAEITTIIDGSPIQKMILNYQFTGMGLSGMS